MGRRRRTLCPILILPCGMSVGLAGNLSGLPPAWTTDGTAVPAFSFLCLAEMFDSSRRSGPLLMLTMIIGAGRQSDIYGASSARLHRHARLQRRAICGAGH